MRSEAAATLIQSIQRGKIDRKKFAPKPSPGQLKAQQEAKKHRSPKVERRALDDRSKRQSSIIRAKSKRGGKNAKSAAHRDLIEGRKKQVRRKE